MYPHSWSIAVHSHPRRRDKRKKVGEEGRREGGMKEGRALRSLNMFFFFLFVNQSLSKKKKKKEKEKYICIMYSA